MNGKKLRQIVLSFVSTIIISLSWAKKKYFVAHYDDYLNMVEKWHGTRRTKKKYLARSWPGISQKTSNKIKIKFRSHFHPHHIRNYVIYDDRYSRIACHIRCLALVLPPEFTFEAVRSPLSSRQSVTLCVYAETANIHVHVVCVCVCARVGIRNDAARLMEHIQYYFPLGYAKRVKSF